MPGFIGNEGERTLFATSIFDLMSSKRNTWEKTRNAKNALGVRRIFLKTGNRKVLQYARIAEIKAPVTRYSGATLPFRRSHTGKNMWNEIMKFFISPPLSYIETGVDP